MAATPNLHPVILETAGLADYRLLDSGNGRKLERFGDMILVRPEEQAIWCFNQVLLFENKTRQINIFHYSYNNN